MSKTVIPDLIGDLLWLESVNSTNTWSLERLPEIPSGTVIAAREQTAGRGQRGNTWFTEPGKNLTFSIVLKPEGLRAESAHLLNYLASVADSPRQDQGERGTVTTSDYIINWLKKHGTVDYQGRTSFSEKW